MYRKSSTRCSKGCQICCHGVKLKLFSSFCLVMVPWMKLNSASDEMSKSDPAEYVQNSRFGPRSSPGLIVNFTFATAFKFDLDTKKML